MKLTDIFGDHPRPDHPDFWKLASICLALDGRVQAANENDQTKAWENTVTDHVDLESLTYVAFQRALRAAGAATKTDLAEQFDTVVKLTTVYLDGFITGCNYKENN